MKRANGQGGEAFRGVLVSVLVVFATSSVGQTAPGASCPAPKDCEVLRTAMQACTDKVPGGCPQFLAAFEKLLPTYDCRREFDRDAYVPAVWLCGEVAHGDAFTFLSKLQTPEARKLFASRAFRESLSGELAEWHRDLLRRRQAPKKK